MADELEYEFIRYQADYDNYAKTLSGYENGIVPDPGYFEVAPKHLAGWMATVRGFVASAVNSENIPISAYRNKKGEPSYRSSALGRKYYFQFPFMVNAIKLLSNDFLYGQDVDSLIDFCAKQGLLTSEKHWGMEWRERVPSLLHENTPEAVALFNSAVEHVRSVMSSPQAKLERRELKKVFQRRYNASDEYVDGLVSRYSRLIAVRVDLSYRDYVKQLVTLKRAQKDIARMLANERSNKIFRGRVGYVLKAEYGASRGFHFHVLYFFDGSKRKGRNHFLIGKLIAKYWESVITKGDGLGRNVNAKYDEFVARGICGIGPIARDDTDRINNLKQHVVRYLCKIEQAVMPKQQLKGLRSFRKGVLKRGSSSCRKSGL